MSLKNICAILLAAGRGTRMQSELPKVLHTLNGKPLIIYPIETLQTLGLNQLITVVKHQADKVVPVVAEYTDIAYQGDEYGTAKAVEAALPIIDSTIDSIMVINGDDSMFYEANTFRAVMEKHKKEKNTITFITLLKQNPTGYGRVVYSKSGKFQKIVEEKDATDSQKNIKEINDGVYLFDKAFLLEHLATIKPSPKTGEYYLTDLINVAMKQKKRVGTYLLPNSSEFFGISTQQDMQQANQLFATAKTI